LTHACSKQKTKEENSKNESTTQSKRSETMPKHHPSLVPLEGCTVKKKKTACREMLRKKVSEKKIKKDSMMRALIHRCMLSVIQGQHPHPSPRQHHRAARPANGLRAVAIGKKIPGDPYPSR